MGAKAHRGARRAAIASRTGGEGEAAAVDANRQGQDGDAANGEMIRKSVTEKEKEKERVTHDAATEGRRKRRRKANKGAHAAATKTTAKVEEDEAKTIAAINVGRMNNGADDPDANKDGYDGDGDGDDDGVAMLANGMEVARRNVDATSKQGDVRWMPLNCFIVYYANKDGYDGDGDGDDDGVAMLANGTEVARRERR